MKIVLLNDYSNKKAGQVLNMDANLGNSLIRLKVAEIMTGDEVKKPTHDELLKMSVSDIKEIFETLNSDELMFLKLNDQRMGIQKMFA